MKKTFNQDYSQLSSSVPSGIISWRRLATNEKMEKYSNHTSWWQKSNSEENSGCAKGFDHTGLKDISYSDICVTGLSNRSPRGCNKGPTVQHWLTQILVASWSPCQLVCWSACLSVCPKFAFLPFASPLLPNCTLQPTKAVKNDERMPVPSSSGVVFDGKAISRTFVYTG